VRAKILIAGADAAARAQVRQHLTARGYDVVEANDAEQAAELALAAAPDLVLFKSSLARGDVFDAASRIKQSRSGEFLPVVATMDLAHQGDRVVGYQAGVDAFLAHPIDFVELDVRLSALVNIRQQHRQLARRNDELVESQRFRDELSSMLVHDLKNPLSVILSNLAYAIEELRRAGAAIDPDVRQSLVESQEAGRRLVRLLTNLADTTRIEAGRLHPQDQETSIGALLDEIAAQRRVMASTRAIRLEVRVGEPLVVPLDRDLVTRALENVVDNSVRYTPSGGRIVLSAARVGDDVEIAIGNDGPPIPVEARHAIFEKYGQTGRAGRMNLGLGLYFCRLAAEAHGGTLELRETPELPTMFVFRLPLQRRARHEQQPPPSVEASEPPDDKKQ
jgi:signal transduction histidine kinase